MYVGLVLQVENGEAGRMVESIEFFFFFCAVWIIEGWGVIVQ